jgi:hypothetical protein
MKTKTQKVLTVLGFEYDYYETVKTNNWHMNLRNKCVYAKTEFLEDGEIRTVKMPLLKIIKLYFLGV